MSEERYAEGIVLLTTDLRESDLLVTILTKEEGKIVILAKGAKKVTSRLIGAVQPLTLGLFRLIQGKNYPILAGSNIKNIFAQIKSDYSRLLISQYFVEIIDKCEPEGQENELLYRLFVNALNHLAEAESPLALIRMFELKLLYLAGVLPGFLRCEVCRKPLAKERSVLTNRSFQRWTCLNYHEKKRIRKRMDVIVPGELIGVMGKLLKTSLSKYPALQYEKRFDGLVDKMVWSWLKDYIDEEIVSRRLLNWKEMRG